MDSSKTSWSEYISTLASSTLKLGGVAMISFGALIYQFQAKLLYPAAYPPDSRTNVDLPSKWHMKDWEELNITSADETKLHCYLIWKKNSETGYSKKTLLYLHANAGNMGHRLPIAYIFNERLDFNVFMVSYRGYGKSEGQPSEQGLKMDAQAALDYILGHDILKNTQVIVYGQSIGGAAGIHLASLNQDKIDGLIVENTFLSIPKLVPHVFPWLSYLTSLCTEIWNSEEAIATLKNLPVLFLSGNQDELVPPSQMEQLFQIVLSNRVGSDKHQVQTNRSAKVFWASFEDATHNDTCMHPDYFDEIEKFIKAFY